MFNENIGVTGCLDGDAGQVSTDLCTSSIGESSYVPVETPTTKPIEAAVAKLSAGAIVLIVLASVAVIGICAFILFKCLREKEPGASEKDRIKDAVKQNPTQFGSSNCAEGYMKVALYYLSQNDRNEAIKYLCLFYEAADSTDPKDSTDSTDHLKAVYNAIHGHIYTLQHSCEETLSELRTAHPTEDMFKKESIAKTGDLINGIFSKEPSMTK